MLESSLRIRQGKQFAALSQASKSNNFLKLQFKCVTKYLRINSIPVSFVTIDKILSEADSERVSPSIPLMRSKPQFEFLLSLHRTSSNFLNLLYVALTTLQSHILFHLNNKSTNLKMSRQDKRENL